MDGASTSLKRNCLGICDSAIHNISRFFQVMSFLTSKQAIALPRMSHVSSEASWNLFSPLMTEYSSIVNLISLVCLGLGLMLFVPVILLVIFDLFLWMWRNICNEDPPPVVEHETVVTTNPHAAAIATGIDKASL
ncbi:hypothetical protein ACLX1H_003476 [Fusarium chlamydosporum]